MRDRDLTGWRPRTTPRIPFCPNRKASAFLAMIVALSLAAGCASQEEDHLAGIAHAMAPEVDSLNGLPTAILDEYRCDLGEEGCRERDEYLPASPLDATAIAHAFGEAMGIPVVRFEVADFPGCPWRAGGPAPSGMWAEFVRPPMIDSDSARVELATGCMTGSSAFEQIHAFALLLDAGEWKVVERRLISIT